jgi:hypothetical protein
MAKSTQRDSGRLLLSHSTNNPVTAYLVHWPIPVKPTTICTETPSLMTSCPVLVPVALGVKTTATEQLVFGARALPHVFVWLKSPLIVMLAIRLDDVPVALSVTVCGALVVQTP